VPTDDRERRREELLRTLAEVQARKAEDPDSWSPRAAALVGEAAIERLRLGLDGRPTERDR